MLSNSQSYNNPLTPPRETRYTPDQTEIVSEAANQPEVVTVDQVKDFLPLRHDQYNLTITDLIDAVTAQIEDYIRLDVIQKNIKSYWYRTPQLAILSRGPHVSITSVKVEDEDGNETTLTEGTHYKIEGMKYKRLYDFTVTGKLTVEYVSGFTEAKRPKQIRPAILQEINLQFKNRQDPDTPAMTSVGNLSLEAKHLLNSIVRRHI